MGSIICQCAGYPSVVLCVSSISSGTNPHVGRKALLKPLFVVQRKRLLKDRLISDPDETVYAALTLCTGLYNKRV